MTRFLQSIVLILNLTPLKAVFGRLYDLGVRQVVAELSKHSAVVSILGSGSYFEERATYGLSDVDLIIVLNENVTRSEPAPREIAYSYERVRRFFPFLGPWSEKEANLVFLSDLAAGFPASESLRVRLKQRRLVTLYGKPPPCIAEGPITTSEVLVEVNTLLRFSLVANPQHALRVVFWKRIFTKLIALVELLNLTDFVKELRDDTELAFLTEHDVYLFFRKSDRAKMFSLQLSLTRRVFDLVAAGNR